MQTSVKYTSDTSVIVTISLGSLELETAEQVALHRLSKETKVPGFREGKAPLNVVAKHVNPEKLQNEILEAALSKAVADAFINEDLQALDRPAVDVKKFVPGELLEFTAEVDVLPKIKIGDYKKLGGQVEKTSVTAADINEILERMQKGFATKKPVKRAAKIGDEVNIDFVGKKDGVAFDGGSAKGHTIELGSNQFIPGFEEGVVGHKAGDEFDIDLKFPDDYHAKDLAGQKVVFTVTLNSVNEASLPEFNDAFAKKAGPFKTMDELKADIKREIAEQKLREAREKRKDDLVQRLIDKSDVPVPDVLLQDQIRSIKQDFEQNLLYRGLTLDSYLTQNNFKDEADWMEKEVTPSATKRVQAGLVLAELSKLENITATDAELEEHVNLYKKQYGNDPELLKRFDEPDVRRDIANRLLTEKTVERLLELN